MNTEEAAAKLKCDTSHVRRLLILKKITGKRVVAKFGVKWIVDRRSVSAYIRQTATLATKGKKRGWQRGKSRTKEQQ